MKLGLGLGINYGGVSLIPVEAMRFISATGITDSTQKRAITYLVRQLKANNLYSKFSVLYPFVGGSTDTHKFNLINPVDSDAAFRIVWSGSVTHDANGIKGNGTNGYGDTKYNPNAASANLTSFSMGLYKTGTEADSGNSKNYLAADNGTSFLIVGYSPSLTSGYGYIGGLSPEYTPNSLVAKENGFVSVMTNGNRNAQLWINGIKKGTAVTQTGLSFPNYSIYILASNSSGTATRYCTETIIKLAYISSGLSDAEMATFHTIVTAYQTLLGRN